MDLVIKLHLPKVRYPAIVMKPSNISIVHFLEFSNAT